MSNYYDREGNPISLHEFAALFETGNYKIVKQTTVDKQIVSTVWLGIDHSFGDTEAPLIFETMLMSVDLHPKVFFNKVYLTPDFSDEWGFQERYSTEEEALKRHDEIVQMIKSVEDK